MRRRRLFTALSHPTAYYFRLPWFVASTAIFSWLLMFVGVVATWKRSWPFQFLFPIGGAGFFVSELLAAAYQHRQSYRKARGLCELLSNVVDEG